MPQTRARRILINERVHKDQARIRFAVLVIGQRHRSVTSSRVSSETASDRPFHVTGGRAVDARTAERDERERIRRKHYLTAGNRNASDNEDDWWGYLVAAVTGRAVYRTKRVTLLDR